MNINSQEILERGGDQTIQLLNYCVYRRIFDPVFIFLAKNYQLMPDSAKALGIYDEFLVQQAPLSLSIKSASDHQLLQAISKIRVSEQSQHALHNSTDDQTDAERPAPFLPSKFLFSNLLTSVAANNAQIASIERQFDPTKSAVENLPDGKLSGAQLQFLEQIWRPARYRLTMAGFRMVANIGG